MELYFIHAASLVEFSDGPAAVFESNEIFLEWRLGGWGAGM